jgi:hypothetical protein
VTWYRRGMRRLLCAAIGAALLVGGCGSSDEDSSKSDEEQIADVIQKMSVALGRGDGEEACSYMTQEGQQIYVDIAEELTDERPDSCEEAVPAILAVAEVESEGASEVEIVNPGDVTVDREAGTASAAGEERGAMQLELVDGEWLVSVPGFFD